MRNKRIKRIIEEYIFKEQAHQVSYCGKILHHENHAR